MAVLAAVAEKYLRVILMDTIKNIISSPVRW